VKNSDARFADDDRQHEAIKLSLTLAHQECSGTRRHGQHPILGLRPGQIVMEEPEHESTPNTDTMPGDVSAVERFLDLPVKHSRDPEMSAVSLLR